MADYKIELGVQLDTSDIKDQISDASKNIKPIELKIDAETKELTNTIKEALNSLSKGTKNALTLDTSNIEKSLNKLSDTIIDIKTSLGTLDSKSGMNNLVSSINQIATALGKVENESDNLVKSLNALSKKDFSINLGIDMNKKNLSTIGYGRAARKQVIPELEAQIKDIEDLFGGKQAAISKLAKQGKNVGFDIFTDFGDFSSDSAIKKMEAMEKYIKSLKKLATIDNVNLDGFNEIHKDASVLINDITGIENAVDKAGDVPEKLKNLFGGGIDGERLSSQLDSIVTDLNEIKTVIQGLSQNNVIEGLSQSFKEMSVVLKDITDNLTIFKNAFSNVGNGLGTSVSNATQELKNNARVLDAFKRSLQNVGMGTNEIDVVANDIKNLGVQIETLNQKKSEINGKEILTVDISGIDKLGNAVKLIREYDIAVDEADNANVNLVKSIDKVSTVHQNAGKSAETFAKQQQRAVTDLTNQINQLNRAAIDQNANRPIKDSSHLDTLKSKYQEIIAAIQKMGNASSATFDDERNEVKRLISEYKSLKSEFKNAENVSMDFKGADFASGLEIAKNRLREFKADAKGFSQVTQTVEQLDRAIEGVGDKSSLDKFNDQLRVAKSELKAVKSEVLSNNDNFANKIRIDIETEKFENKVSQLHSQLDQLTDVDGSLDNLRASIKQVDDAYDAMKIAAKANDDESLIQSQKRFAAAVEKTNNELKIQAREQRAANNAAKLADSKTALKTDMLNWLKKNSKAAKEYKADIDRLIASLNKLDQAGVNGVRRQFSQIDKDAELKGLKGLNFFDSMKSKIKEYSVYFGAAEMFMYAEQGLRDMFEQVKLIDSAMTELKKVTNETDAAYNKFLTNAADRARAIGTTIDGLVSSTADFARLGYGFEDAQGLAEVANIYAVVGDEIEGVEGATESLISTMAAFKDEMNGMSNTDFAMSIIDKFNEIGNNFAISSGGIGEALERSASSLMAANNTIDESIALITAANTVVQDPEQVGTAFKTISMRIRGAKTELEEAGLETDGMVESTAKLRSEILALTGVDIMDGANQFKSTYAIMDELADKWKDLSDIQQATVTELIAGKRQGNIVSSLMANFDTARDALETSMNSAGSAMQEHEKWQKSLEAQILKLKASWQSLSQAFLSSNFLKTVLDGVINLVDGLTKLIDTFGTLPTLIGTVAAGFSAFKNQGLFKFDKDAQSIKLLGNQLTGLKDKYTQIHTAIDRYNSLSTKSASFQEKYNKAMANSSTSMGKYLSGLKGAKASFGGYISSLIGATVKTIALEAATIALNAALTMGISLAIQAIVTAIDKWIVTSDELAEKVDEIISKFEEEHNALQKLKGDYDTSNESSMISKYEKLSKGVDHLGRNVSLTTDEYSEYQNIVNQIADQIPSLVSGYDSQGNALLSCKGNVEELTQAYEDLIKAQNREIFNNAGDIGKDFKNAVKDAESSSDGLFGTKLSSSEVKFLEQILNGEYTQDEIYEDYLHNNLNISSSAIAKALGEAGVDDISKWSSTKKIAKALVETKKNNPEIIKNIIDDFNADLEAAIEGMESIAQATLSDAFDIRSSDYYGMSDTMKSVAENIVNSFDYEFYKQFKDNPLGVKTYINDMLDQLKAISKTDGAKIEAVFDLQTQFNGGEISYGEYVDGLTDTGEAIDKLVSSGQLDKEIGTQLKLSIGLDEKGLVDEYQRLRNRLADSNYFNISEPEYESFIKGLSAEELSVVWDVAARFEKTDVKETIADFKSAVELEMMKQGLTFDLNLEVEAAGIEALNTALAESVSASGLSSESITALKGRYADLEAKGYDLSVLFEETSHGIHLNRQEFNKLEKAYATDKLAKVDGELAEMKATYDDLGAAIKNTDDPVRKAELYNDRQTLAKKISEAATLAAQYEGLTSAYNDWLAAEEAGQERDMYENVVEGFENIGDEISRGWYDDGTIKFLEMLTGRTDLAGKSAKELKKIYDNLDKSIKYVGKDGKVLEDTGYSVRDFFTVDDEGNSTADGVYNFLDAIGKLEEEAFGGKDIVKRDKNGKPISFDFELAGGDEAIAEALGVSEELVQIMKRAADDAGFVVSLDGTYKQLADLQNEARESAEYLKSIGKTDFEFDFNSTNLNNLNKQLEEAHKILDDPDFWNKDGTFNFDAKGATEAMQIVSTLQAKIDQLTEEKYGIGLTVEDEKFEEPLENLQEYGRTVQTLNQLKLNPKANTEEIKELEGDLEEISKYFANLDEDLKVELGFEADDNWEEVQKKIESGEVKIPTVLDIQANMDKNIETLADLALLNSGLLSDSQEETIKKKYKIDVEADEVDTSDVDDKVDDAVNSSGGKEATRKQNVQIIADVFGVEDVNDLSSKLEGLDDKTIQAIAEVLGRTDVDLLQNTMAKLEPKTVEAIAKAIGKGDVEGLKEAIINIPNKKHAQAIAEALGYDDVNALANAVDDLDPKTVQAIAQALGISDVNTLQVTINNMHGNTVDAKVDTSGQAGKVNSLQITIDGMQGNTVTAGVNTDGQASKVDTLQTKINSLKGKIVNVGVQIAAGGKKKAAQRTGADPAGNDSEANGTANVNGTVGRAFKQGSWGTKNSGTALVGELGREILVRNGRYYTIGDNGAEFIKYKKGDIIFNHVQSEELFKNGKVTSGGGRARAFAQGTAFDTGTGGGEYGGSAVGSNNKDKTEETFDWIETLISRLERTIDNLDQTVNNVYKSWSDRNAALTDEISEVGKLIGNQESAYNAYMAEANKVGLDESWASKVRNGTIDINTITDENLAEKIKDYETWYEKALAAKDAIEELKETESELYEQRFENIQAQYDGILQGFEHTESILEEYISQAEEKGHIVSKNYYQALIDNEEAKIVQLKNEQSELIAARNELTPYTEAWYDMCAEIDSVTQSIESATTATIEWSNEIRNIDWEVFDRTQERISDIIDEADFLIELMSNDKLHNDDGSLTDKGTATMGQHALKYNTYMYQADDYGAKVKEIDDKIASGEYDPYDDNVIDKRREWLELQRESILAAEDEKESMRDLVEEGIEVELDALQELIDKKNEELESEKDLYEYQKKVKEQTEEIASLEKQLAAYSGDNSEEARAKIQELKVSLEEAKTNLEETEYDKYLSDTQQMLDTLYDDYELTLNARLDNLDYLVQGVIDAVNSAAGVDGTLTTALGADGAIATVLGANATTIKTTLENEVRSVGTSLSTAMSNIWNAEGSGNKVITMYGEGFQQQQTTTNTVLNSIKTSIDRMVDDVDKDATAKVKSNKTITSAKKKPTTTSTTKKTTTTNKTSSAGDGKPKIGDKVMFLSGQYYYDSQGKTPLGSKNHGKQVYITNINTKKWATHPIHISTGKKLGSGDLGWLKKSQISGYAIGKKNFLNNEIAWTQENGKEFIVRPSDGAILTPIAKGDSVLNAQASGNIWDMANSPADFIKDNLNLGTTGVPNNSNVSNSTVQNFENIVFSMPNVKNYGELLSEFKNDPKFEKLILAMTLDQVTGKSKLAKGKSIR